MTIGGATGQSEFEATLIIEQEQQVERAGGQTAGLELAKAAGTGAGDDLIPRWAGDGR